MSSIGLTEFAQDLKIMRNFIKKNPIYFAVICLVAVGIVCLFICSYCNHVSVNRNCQINIENLSMSFKETKAEIEIIKDSIHHEDTQNNSMEQVSKELNSLLFDIKNAKREIIRQYQNIFDANTVTFLVTFLSALLFTVFITLFIKNMEQYNSLYQVRKELYDRMTNTNEKLAKTDENITNADKKIIEADKKIADVNNRIVEAEYDWKTKIQNLKYVLNLCTERNYLTQILNLVSVLGSHLASSDYIIKPEYATLVYMTHRKTQSLLKEGFKDIKTIRQEDKTELKKIITDCITYLNIETLSELNKDGLIAFKQLDGDLNQIRDIIQKIPLQKE